MIRNATTATIMLGRPTSASGTNSSDTTRITPTTAALQEHERSVCSTEAEQAGLQQQPGDLQQARIGKSETSQQPREHRHRGRSTQSGQAFFNREIQNTGDKQDQQKVYSRKSHRY